MWEGERVVRRGERVGGEGVNGVGTVEDGGGGRREGLVALAVEVEVDEEEVLEGRFEDLGIFCGVEWCPGR